MEIWSMILVAGLIKYCGNLLERYVYLQLYIFILFNKHAAQQSIIS